MTDMNELQRKYDTVLKTLVKMLGFTHQILNISVNPTEHLIEFIHLFEMYALQIREEEPWKVYIVLRKLTQLGERILAKMPPELVNRIANKFNLKVYVSDKGIYFRLDEILGRGLDVDKFIMNLHAAIKKIEDYILNEVTNEVIDAYIVSKYIGDNDENRI